MNIHRYDRELEPDICNVRSMEITLSGNKLLHIRRVQNVIPMNILLLCRYIFVHVSVYVYMCRHVYVYEYDCFMYVHMCIYCVCMYFMATYIAVRIALVLK